MSDRIAFDSPDAERSIVARLRRVARAVPDAIAIRDDGRDLSYRELVERVDAVAAALVELDPPGPLVGVFADHGVDAAVGTMAVLAAGRTVLVLDPQQPPGHHERVIEQSELRTLLCSEDALEAATALPVEHRPRLSHRASAPTPLPEPGPSTLAYLIYTSGSTGRPKGVMHTHANGLVHAAESITGQRLGPGDRLAMVARFTVGAGLNDLMTALLTGATVCPFDLRRHGVVRLAAWLDEERIDVLRTVPTVCRQLVAAIETRPELELDHLRLLGLGGETVLASDVRSVRRAFPSCELLVGLGSSETHRIVEMIVDDDTEIEPRVPVGRPLPTAELVLLGPEGAPIGPDERVGELCVRGRYIGLGYWNDEAMTAARFEPVPGRPGVRQYRSGDRMERRDDGTLAFVAREHERVMIAGNTVMLPEVEAALGSLPSVVAAVVGTEHAGAEHTLIAWVQPRSPDLTASDVRARLADLLPVHMVPRSIRLVDPLPRTPSGKVDRRALARLPSSTRASASASAGPTSTTERAMVVLWRELLGDPELGIHDDFFERGGQSLQAVALLEKVDELYGKRYTTAHLLRHPTPARFADLLSQRRADDEDLRLLAPLREHGRGVPLVCLPGIGGSPVAMRELAARIDAPVLGVDFNPLLSLRPCPGVPELARSLVAPILRACPRGPIRVLGYSLGGLVAFELACLLPHEGRPVERLVVLDALRPGTPAKGRKRDRIRHHLHRLRSSNPVGAAQYLWEHARRYRHGRPPRVLEDDEVNHPLLADRHEVAAVARRYEPGWFPGGLHLLLCDDPALPFPTKPDGGGWTDRVARVRTWRVALGHHELFAEGNVARWASQLERMLA